MIQPGLFGSFFFLSKAIFLILCGSQTCKEANTGETRNALVYVKLVSVREIV
jgi:hypothetical protein